MEEDIVYDSVDGVEDDLGGVRFACQRGSVDDVRTPRCHKMDEIDRDQDEALS